MLPTWPYRAGMAAPALLVPSTITARMRMHILVRWWMVLSTMEALHPRSVQGYLELQSSYLQDTLVLITQSQW